MSALEPANADLSLMLAGALMMLAWEAGHLSEGQLAAALKTDRLTLRVERDKLIQQGMDVFATFTRNAR